MGFDIRIGDLIVPTFTLEDARTKENREIFDLEANETVSILDPVFEEHRKQVGILQRQNLTKAEIIQASRKAIGDHFYQRLQSAFQQCIACFGTGFSFEEGHVEHQGPSARKLGSVPFNAAHISTTPCLYAVDGEGKKIFLFKFSDMYLWANSTNELTKDVNNSDIAIDGANENAGKSRQALIKILNELSKKVLSPDEALVKFYSSLKKNIEAALTSKTVKKETKLVLDIYKENLAEIGKRIEDDRDTFFDQLLNVNGTNDLTGRVRQIIYKQRYEIIQKYYAIQSGIRKKIAETSAAILGIDRKPPHFDYVFKGKLLDKCSPSACNILQRMFGLSKDCFRLKHPRSGAAMRKIDSEENQTRIVQLMKDLAPLIKQFKKSEFDYQRRLLIDLRNCLGYSQSKLAEIFKKKFPNSTMSQPTLCRTERGEREVGSELWKRMASLLKIDEGNFFPLLRPLT